MNVLLGGRGGEKEGGERGEGGKGEGEGWRGGPERGAFYECSLFTVAVSLVPMHVFHYSYCRLQYVRYSYCKDDSCGGRLGMWLASI